MTHARSVADFVRDQDTARAARMHYREQARRLDSIARDLAEAGADSWARDVRYFAAIAVHAARAEFFDPDWRA